MKKILLTGGCGFIGSHLLDELVKNKNYEITVIDDLSTGKLENIKPIFHKIKFFSDRIQDLDLSDKYDIIYHLAAKANTRETGMADFIDNVMATEVVTKMLKPNGHIYFSSSCAVYGNQSIVTENSPFQPISPYGYSKWMCELIIKNHCKKYTIFRFSNVFGERQDGSGERGLIGIIEYCFKYNKTIKVFNEGKNYRDYIYVLDVVKAMITIHENDVFQVGRNQLHNTLDLIKLTKIKWEYGENNNQVSSIKLDNSKLKKLGWKPTLSVVDYIIRIKNERSNKIS